MRFLASITSIHLVAVALTGVCLPVVAFADSGPLPNTTPEPRTKVLTRQTAEVPSSLNTSEKSKEPTDTDTVVLPATATNPATATIPRTTLTNPTHPDTPANDSKATHLNEPQNPTSVVKTPHPIPNTNDPTQDTPPKVKILVRSPKETHPLPSKDLSLAIDSVRNLPQTIKEAFPTTSLPISPPPSPYQVVTPVVIHPRWQEAMNLLADQQCSKAKAIAESILGPFDQLKSDTDPNILYITARLDLCLRHQPQDAEKQLSSLAKRDDALGYVAATTMNLSVYHPNFEIFTQAPQSLKDLIQEAYDIAKQGDTTKALQQLDELYTTTNRKYERFAVRGAQATILETMQQFDQAADIYLQLYRRSHGSSLNEHFENRLEFLEQQTKKTYLSFGDRVNRVVHLVRRGRYKDAKRESIRNTKLRKFNASEIKGMTDFRLGLIAERKRDRKKAVKYFESADRRLSDPDIRPYIYMNWARALRRLDQDLEAIELYKRLATEYPDHHLVGEARYQAGRLLQFLDQHHEAIQQFNIALSAIEDNDIRDEDPTWASDALWRAAFSHILEKEWPEARRRLQRLQLRFGEETDASDLSLNLKASYWIAMTHLYQGHLHQAQRGFQRTLNLGKLTWYGQLAIARLKQHQMPYALDLPEQRLEPEIPVQSLNAYGIHKDPRLGVAMTYANLGLWQDARKAARPLLNAHPDSKGAATLIAATDLIQNNPAAAHWRMRHVIDEAGPTQDTLMNWATAFPNAYASLAETFGNKYRVPPSLVQAIIRQESGFRPKVRSHAGAIGLMQLMPKTARYVARTFSQKLPYSRRALTKPEVNIELGTMYIKLQTAYALNSVPIALAAYNAGTGPQNSWLERYGDRDLDLWVESITFQEARGYVRKVFTSYTVYSKLYYGYLPPLDLEAPKRLRDAKRVWGELEVKEAKGV